MVVVYIRTSGKGGRQAQTIGHVNRDITLGFRVFRLVN